MRKLTTGFFRFPYDGLIWQRGCPILIIYDIRTITISMMSSSFRSHENLLSSQAMGRSEAILNDSPNFSARHQSRNRGCVYGTDGNGDAAIEVTSVQTEKQLLKNLVVLGIGHILAFSAFTALQSLQSSLFLETGIGLKSLCTLYCCAVFSGLYSSAFVQRLTPNWTIVLSVVLMSLFISAFFYPRLYSLIPCAIVLGLIMGPFYIAEMTLLMTLINRVSYLTSGIREKVQQKYLRLFMFFINSGRVWGHVVVGLLMHYGGTIYVFFTGNQQQLLHGVSPRFSMADINMSPSPYATVARPSLCALETSTEDHIYRSPTSYVFILPLNLTLMLISVFLGLSFLGVATVTSLLDKCDMYVREDMPDKTSIFKHVYKILTAFFDPQFRLWIPMMIFLGLNQGFLNADFTRSYVSCALGLEAVAYTMLCYAGVNTITSLMVHALFKYIRKAMVMITGIVCQFGLLMVLWLWNPVKDDISVFYIIATGWGVCNAIWETHLMTYLNVTFIEEWQAPFIAYYMCQCVGMASSLAWSPVFINEIKVYILAGFLAIAIIPYSVLELGLHYRRKEQERITEL